VSFVEVGGKRCAGLIAAALIALVCALALPAAAAAETYEVDSTADEPAVVVGVCASAGGKCTLRAAIQASNSTAAETDGIRFDESVFEGQLADTITLGSSLPPITNNARIEGRQCATTAAGVSGPCQGINGPNAASSALTIENTNQVEIEGLAVTGARTGINISGGSAEIRVKGSWLGVKLDGSADGNTTGIFIDPESNGNRIGGESVEARNVFANNGGEGLEILGADDALVLGNYFGVEPDGVTPAANGKNIEVVSQLAGGFVAEGNLIGVQPPFTEPFTSACDIGCNVISGATTNGIDLQGDTVQGESPSVETHVAGNFIGLAANGSVVANATAGVRVGSAGKTVVGGSEEDEANRINGGQFGVFAGNAGVAEDLDILNNVFGRNDGGGTLTPPGAPVSIDSAGLASEVDAAEVTGNLISMSGVGIAIEQHGPGALISANQISGAGYGVRTYGDTELIGNLIADNEIEDSEADGILVENDLNEVLGNEVFDSGGSGIRIQSFGGVLPATENLIGGDVGADENLISGSDARAIEISAVEETINEVARNRGSANSGPFIDLLAVNPGTEPIGPNGGIKPPAFSTSTQSTASGRGAKEGAVIRVFRKASPEPGELESFLAETQADAAGNWKVAYPTQIPTGTIVAATQTSKDATSELTTATSTADPVKPKDPTPPTACPAAGPPKCPVTTQPPPIPQTKINKGPKAKSASTAATFKFSSNVKGSTFQCKLDKGKFKKCKSPKKYKGLKVGKHVFKVRAVNSAGVADPTPAKRKFTVLG
jgi:hypothetical protein